MQFITEAQKHVENPEVQAMIQSLAKYGLGVFVPHAHDSNGNFIPLDQDVVQVERENKVSFHPASEVALDESVAVGWRWDEQNQTAMFCIRCLGQCQHM